jgi:hypothetical protein
MPRHRSALRPILVGMLGAIAIVMPARAAPPDTTMRHALYSFTPRAPRDFAAERRALDARARAEIHALSDPVRSQAADPARDALLRNLSDAVRRHRIARLRLDVEAACARGDRAAADRIAAILARFERPRPRATAGARTPAREGAGR